MTFGETIATKRKELGIAQKELARRVDISPQYLNDIEFNRRNPDSDELIKKFAKELHLEPEILYYQARKLPPEDLIRDASHEKIVSAMKAFRRTIKSKR
jgi:transcriptional regulator with XRE-family HTH domain